MLIHLKCHGSDRCVARLLGKIWESKFIFGVMHLSNGSQCVNTSLLLRNENDCVSFASVCAAGARPGAFPRGWSYCTSGSGCCKRQLN